MCVVYIVSMIFDVLFLTFIADSFTLHLLVPTELIQEKKRAMENTMHLDHQILNQQQMLELQAVANLANKGKHINAVKKEAGPEQK